MKSYWIIVCGVCMTTLTAFAQINPQQVDWSIFLSKHDMLWEEISSDYYSGAIMGNGLLGANIYKAEQPNTFRWDIGRSDVNESRPGTEVLYEHARLPIGYFTLTTAGEVMSSSMRLNLYDAIATGKIVTDSGAIEFQTYVDANHNMIVIETSEQGSEKPVEFNWNPEEALSPRTRLEPLYSGTPDSYREHPNPAPVSGLTGDISYHLQPLFSGKAYVTAWIKEKTTSGCRMYVTISFSDSPEKALAEASQTLNAYKKKDQQKAVAEHKKWWNGYYPSSFVSFPDGHMESFYWIQQYKLACLTRKDKLIIDLMGPWTTRTPWPAIWWNLNMQLTYSPLFTANRLELSEPVWNAFNKHLDNLIANVPVPEWREDAAAIGRFSSYGLISPLRMDLVEKNQYEVGNLTWALFYYWQYCTYKADSEELVNRFYPLLKRSIAYYSHILYRGEDGRYHLPMTASPEYSPAEDCNYDLSLLRWGLKTLTAVNKKYNLNDPLQEHWHDVMQNLVDYPADPEQGYMIGKDVPLKSSHRHYSHLLMIYPLCEITWDDESNREIIAKSIAHWMSMKGALQGYSYSGSASMYAQQGDGVRAVSQLTELLNKYIQPNTLYKEAGPVVETPLSAAASIQELFLQSYNGLIRVFPAIPEEWQEASFMDFRAENGFLISALRRQGETCYIQVKAEQRGLCNIQTGQADMQIRHANNPERVNYRLTDIEKGIFEIPMEAGEIVVFSLGSYECKNDFIINHPEKETNTFGQRK